MLDIEECFSMSHKIQFFWEHYGQTVPFIVLLFTRCLPLMSMFTFSDHFLCNLRDACLGFGLFYFDHWRASSGSKVARSLIPLTTLAPEHIGHFSPAKPLLTPVCHSCPQLAFHHTFLLEPYVILSSVSSRFLCAHPQNDLGKKRPWEMVVPQGLLYESNYYNIWIDTKCAIFPP